MTDRAAEVDAYIAEQLLGDDAALAATLRTNATAGLPAIDVSAAQGRMLQLMARMVGAKSILEIGTLGGYSTIELARALPADGRLMTLEINPRHAEVARGNIAAAGLADRVEVIVGPAVDTLQTLAGPFDFVFIDADKPSGPIYLHEALRLSRPGTAIVVDNVVRNGGLIDASSTDANIQGSRSLVEMVAAEPRLSATVVQTVGAKHWDGFLLAIVS